MEAVVYLYGLGFENVAVGRVDGVAVLTGYSNTKWYGHFAEK